MNRSNILSHGINDFGNDSKFFLNREGHKPRGRKREMRNERYAFKILRCLKRRTYLAHSH